MTHQSIIILYKSKKTVFTTADLSLLWDIHHPQYLKTKIHRLIKVKKLISIKNGFYALSDDVNTYELANVLKKPSYVSLQTILKEAGALFQYDTAIHSISNISKTIRTLDREYRYRSIKDSILYSKEGIEAGIVTKATPERAWLDWLYLYKDASIDNPNVINVNECKKLLPIYQNKSLEKRFYSWCSLLSSYAE